ncbi:acetyltransferase [Photobacterium sp. GB-50]|uniref:arylamine N-acetyltransferase family protein n=1 Tax=Photobacterium sp. GB-50 TaxID=2022107 RepID=UPI000D17D2A2|nr:arylamine N-acetyltransferase [Photobacterium sp. GB-50]PSW73523.1 acetyltransferase [Photobacterium sp. GB-50]
MNKEMLSAYLEKIGFQGNTSPDLTTLFALHQHQHSSIPFENLDIVNGRTVELDEDKIFNKLVYSNRGGYCFELNSLMNRVLKTLQFNVEKKLARVHLTENPSGRGHLVNIVTFNEQQWLVDTGFGSNTPRAPLPITFNQELKEEKQTFRFIEDAFFGMMLQCKVQEQWINQYSLDMSYVCDGDIEYANHYASTHSNSRFTTQVVAVARTEHGNNILLNNRLKLAHADAVTETFINDVASFHQILKQHFGIDNPVQLEKFEQYLLIDK